MAIWQGYPVLRGVNRLVLPSLPVRLHHYNADLDDKFIFPTIILTHNFSLFAVFKAT